MSAKLFDTPITRLFGIRHPILCGGLMWLSTHGYVAAVARAGGIGFITPRSYGGDPEAFREGIKRCRDLAEGNPFGVNLYISARPKENELLQHFAEVVLQEGVRFVETAGYSPRVLLPPLVAGGVTVIHKATSIKHAVAAQAAGAHAIALVGTECGGHPGPSGITTLVLGARAAEELTVPFVVGGGIGTGAQVAAALALGADGVLLGTRMVVADEVWAHAGYKDHLLDCDETSTTLVLTTLNNPYRCLANATAAEVIKREREGTVDYESLLPYISGRICRETYETGDWSRGILSLGPSIAFARQRQPVADIFAALIEGARAACNRMDRLTA